MCLRLTCSILTCLLIAGSSTEFYDDDEDEEHENEVDEDAFSPVQGNKCVLVAAAADYDDDDNTTTLTKMTTMSVVLETAVMVIMITHTVDYLAAFP